MMPSGRRRGIVRQVEASQEVVGTMSRTSRLVPILAAFALLMGCTATRTDRQVGDDTRKDQNRVVLTIATGESFPAEASGYADAVAQASGGSIKVVVDNRSAIPDLNPSYETDVINYVAEGKAELGFVVGRAFDTVGVPAFDPLVAPFLIDTYDLEARVLRSPEVESLLAMTRPAGVVGLGYVQGSLRRPLGLSRPLLTLADYGGARIGIRANGVIESGLKAMGATPVVFQPGVTAGLDGIEMHIPGIDLSKYDIGADSLTGNVVLWPRVGVIFANADAFDAMSSEQQTILREAARINLDDAISGMHKSEQSFLDNLCLRGLSIKMAPGDAVSELQAAVKPVYDEIRRDAGASSLLDTISDWKASTNAPVDPVECALSPASPLPTQFEIDSPLVGTWTTSFSFQELQDSPSLMDAGELNDGNWGDLTVTFTADGHVSMQQRNDRASGSVSGTFAINDDQVVMAFTEGENRGETFVGGWSIFGDTLTFARLDAGILPTPFLVRAWTRAASAT